MSYAEYQFECAAWPDKKARDTVCRAALALLLARYQDAHEARFSVVARSESAEKLLPIRAPVAPRQPIADLYRFLRSDRDDSAESEHRVAPHTSALDRVVLAVPGAATTTARAIDTATLLVECCIPSPSGAMGRHSCTMRAHFIQDLWQMAQAQWFLAQLGHLINALPHLPSDSLLVQDVSIASPRERSYILDTWNATPPPPISSVCVHDCISRWAAEQPRASAIAAWDGTMTYQELDRSATLLAAYLLDSLHLVREQPVLLAFEKSKWVAVAMLAVLKAGGVIVLVDSSLPATRIKQIARQTSAVLALASISQSNSIQASMSKEATCVVVGNALLESLPQTPTFHSPAGPSHLAYILFTSGSTGEPKGTMVEHQAFASSCLQFGPAFGINADTRALQFASYAFGACLVEILTVLMLGGCVCIPSDQDRSNALESFICRFDVNWAVFTPTFVRVIRPDKVPNLRTLNLGGEPVTNEVRDIWAAHARIVFVYGQSETSTCCISTDITASTTDFRNIGRPVGARAWVTDVDDVSRLAPIGCTGELVIESWGVARGYLRADETQASAFLHPTPDWLPGGEEPTSSVPRLYRTGDLVRYAPDGSLIHLGRKDRQIKIRGQKVEIGEVETQLRRCCPSLIRNALVDVAMHPEGSQRTVIVGFIELMPCVDDLQPDADTLLGTDGILSGHVAQDIQNALQSHLPGYSVPSYLIHVRDIPTTATGKVDRLRLRRLAEQLLAARKAQRTSSHREGVLPSSIEQQMRQLWGSVLKISPTAISSTDSFFQLGGDSIAAIELCVQARERGLDLHTLDIFNTPVLGQLVVNISQKESEDCESQQIFRHDFTGRPVELSSAQRRLWFLDQLDPSSCAYLIPLAARIGGPLEIAALNSALQLMIERHQMLRTVFELRDGEACQLVQQHVQMTLRLVEVQSYSDAMSLLHHEQSTPLDLLQQPWRAVLFKLGAEDHILSIVFHHILIDGWSVDVFCRELSFLYRTNIGDEWPRDNLPRLSINYADFTHWQKEWINSVECQAQLAYWEAELQDSSPAELIHDHPRPDALLERAGLSHFVIDGDAYAGVHSFARGHENGITAFVVLLAAFRAAHFRLTGAVDATIGTPVANRTQKELQNIIGIFVNTVCIRTVVEQDTFEDLIQLVRAKYVAAMAHQDVPFDKVMSKVQSPSHDDGILSRISLAQMVFAFHPQSNLCELQFGNTVECQGLPMTFFSRSDLEFHIFQQKDAWHGRVHFAREVYDNETVETLVSVFKGILVQGICNPDLPVLDIPLPMTVFEERSLKIERTDYPRGSSIIEVFRAQARSSPHTIAVKDPTRNAQMTYSELDMQSSLLAAWLQHELPKAPPETIIPVLADRSCHAIVAFLGIMKAHFAYLPLDSNAPPGRLSCILAILPHSTLMLLGPGITAPELDIKIRCMPIQSILTSDSMSTLSAKISSRATATSLAYVIFTSGSTGHPKGVMIEHRGVVRLCRQNAAWNQVPPNAKVAHMSNLAFDVSTWEIYTPLLNGGAVICVDEHTVLDPKALATMFHQERIQAAKITPLLLKQCLASAPETFATLEVLYTAGDQLDLSTCMKARTVQTGGLGNAYGPTENTGASTAYIIEEDLDLSTMCRIPIGEPISNSGACVVDRHYQPVTDGVVGELIVYGDGLARGYLDPAQNCGRFMTLTLNGESIRAYRTGDRARRRRQDGQIEFLGRIDHQVKVRGHRVELDEIERVILSEKAVSKAVVVLREGEGDQEPDLTAFVSLSADQADALEQQRVDDWVLHFDETLSGSLDAFDTRQVGRDFIGWFSMYDGRPIDKLQMEEWLEDALATILELQPKHVLEIGTGTGMILFNLGTIVQSYIGLEPSRRAVNFVQERARSVDGRTSNIQVLEGTAQDVSRFEDVQIDTVILNSVVQYFPSRAYLQTVLDHVLSLNGLRRVYIGDVRAHSLRPLFLAAKALHELGEDTSKKQVLDFMVGAGAHEEELFVDPAFFTNLSFQRPDIIEHVEIRPKQMRSVNELSAFRYAVILHIRPPEDLRSGPREIRGEWQDFARQFGDYTALRDYLTTSPADLDEVAVENIPDQRSRRERATIRALQSGSREDADAPGWLAIATDDSGDVGTVSPSQLHDLARDLGFRVQISWARLCSQNGGFDAVFFRDAALSCDLQIPFRFPVDSDVQETTNKPMQRDRTCEVKKKMLRQLQCQLPSYMVPSDVVVLEDFPMTASGKVDRPRLTRMAQTLRRQDKMAMNRGVMPRSETETIVYEEFSSVLGKPVGIFDSFFELGGHSLMATRLIARLRHRLSREIPLSIIFIHPTVAAIAKHLLEELSPVEHISIPSSLRWRAAPMSCAQDRLWFVHQLESQRSSRPSFFIPMAVRLRGLLRMEALEIALQTIVKRHETLRTTFELRDGVGVQIVHEYVPRALKVVDISTEELLPALTQEQLTVFDFHALPAWRVVLFRLCGRAEEEHVLSLVMHHLIADAWSVDIFCRELSAFYAAALRSQKGDILPPPTIQYRDYAAWEKESSQQANYRDKLAYWTRSLADSRPAQLPYDFLPSDQRAETSGVVHFIIDGPLYRDLIEYARRRGMAPFVLLLAAFRAAHYRCTMAEDAAIGIPVAAHREKTELSGLIGLFVNVICVRLRVEDDTSFIQLVQQVHREYLSCMAHQDVPFEQVVAQALPVARDSSHNPLVRMAFALHSLSNLGLRLEGLQCENLPVTLSTNFDLECHLTQASGKFEGRIIYAEHLFRGSTIENFAAIFQGVLELARCDSTMPIADLHLATEVPIAQHAAPRRPQDSRNLSIVDHFRGQVILCPHEVAVKDAVTSTQITYMELENASDRLALWLQKQEFPVEALIAVLANRSVLNTIAYMGILKANLAYLPLDTNAPRHRLEAILTTISGRRLVLLGHNVQFPSIDLEGCRCVSISDALNQAGSVLTGMQVQISTPTNANFHPASPTGSSLAYVMFTSGSTGEPKGVMIEHRGVVLLVKQSTETTHCAGRSADLRIAHMTNLAFDPATVEIFTALLNGGTLICVDPETVVDPPSLARTFEQHAVRMAIFTPSLVKLCLSTHPGIFRTLTEVHVTGERLGARDCRAVRGIFDGMLFNDYGPVENTVWSTRYQVESPNDFGDIVPIGRAFGHSSVVVVDRKARPVPLGVCGELMVFGDGLARGYTKTSLNAGRFIGLTLNGTHVRAYRTGDAARCRFDGQIEFLGRKDGQIKVRGHRVELDEIERAILRNDHVSDAAVVARSGSLEEVEIIAFVTSSDSTAGLDTHHSEGVDNTDNTAPQRCFASIETRVKHKLRTTLATYMIPKHIVLLKHMPSNAHGKIDKRVLQRQAMDLQENAVTTALANETPRNSTEIAVSTVFSEILSQPIGFTDNFFESGGHSLLAVKIAARLSHKLQALVSVRDVFECPTVADLAARIRLARARYEPIPRCASTQPVELSFTQSRFWFLEHLSMAKPTYHMPIAVRMCGDLAIPALEMAISGVIERHEILRTTFEQQEDSGLPQQIVHPHRPHNLLVVTISSSEDLSSALHEHQTRQMNLHEALWRVTLFRCSPKHHTLSMVFHHCASDAWSVDILCRELSQIYRAVVNGKDHALPAPAIQYRDFASWQRQQSSQHSEQLDYWREQLEDSQPAELICDFSRPQELSGVAEGVRFDIDEGLFEAIIEFGRAKQFTPFVILLTAFRATVYRMMPTEDATVGTFSAGRDREELAGVMGCFVNTHALRIRVEQQTFEVLAREVQEIHLAALANADVPFEQVVSNLLPGARDASRHPLFQLTFALHSQLHWETPKLEGLSCDLVPAQAPSIRFDAAMHVYQHERSMSGVVLYSPDLFHRSTIESFFSVFRSLIRRALMEPDIPVRDLIVMPDPSELYARGLLNPNETKYPRELSVVDIFEEQVRANGSRTAVKDSHCELSYEELNERAGLVAAWLRQRGLLPETVVGVLAPRSCQAIIAFLGILKAGLAYLPLDINHPAARSAQVLSCVKGQKIVIFDAQTTTPEGVPDTEFVPLERILAFQMDRPLPGAGNRSTAVTRVSTSLAYVMFTSGSTGTPKGVMVEDRAIVQLVKGDQTLRQLRPGMRYAHLSSLAFDAATWEIYSALLNGSTVVCIDHEAVLDPLALSAAFAKDEIQVALLTVALLKGCIRLCPKMISQLVVLLTGGERMHPQDATRLWRLLPRGAYYACGFTEASVMSTAHEVEDRRYPSHGPPIGRPISNCNVYVTDHQLRIVPVGVMGELVVAGDGLARGYLSCDLDQGRFVEIEVNGHRQRAYRTGDRARWRPVDGELEHFGRIKSETQQVKIRGHRLELEEVEYVLCECSVVRAAAVVHDPSKGELIAHIVIDADAERGERKKEVDRDYTVLRRRIRQELQASLPSFMVPSVYIFTSRLPINSSGKIDRNALVRQGGAELECTPVDYVPPRDQLEHEVCEEFAIVLGRPQCGVTDSFFDLGGHSLLAMKAAARISRRFNADVTAGDIFQTPVLRDLSNKVRLRSKLYTAIPKIEVDGSMALSFAQARLFFLYTTGIGQSQDYTMPLALRLTGRLNVTALAAALDAIERRHEILRTTYHHGPEGIGSQTVHVNLSRELRIVQIHDPALEIPLQLEAERNMAFDLEQHPSWRTLLLRIDPDQHVLSIVMHHIASDGWSIDVLRNELALFYSAALSESELRSQLSPLCVQYRHYAAWQRLAEQLAEQRVSLQYWKEQLANNAAAELPCDYCRPAEFCSDADEVYFSIEGDLYHSLTQFCRKHEVTPFIVLFAVFRASHYRLTGAQDGTIGTPAANRNRAEVEPLIGFFVNILCIRLAITDDTSFRDLLKQSRRVVTEALVHQDAPFEQLVSELSAGSRDASRAPLVQLIFAVFSTFRTDDWRLENLKAEMIPTKPTSRYDLEVHLVEEKDGYKGSMMYAAALFDSKTIKNLVSVFSEILRRVLQDPSMCIIDIPLTDDVPELRVQGRLKIQRTPYPRDRSIVDLFREQALASPKNIAVVDDSTQWTYGELDRASHLLAQWLHRAFNFASETVVVVIAPRSCYTIAAFLGVLRIGCAYLPLECDTPSTRIAEILSSVSARLGCILLGSGCQCLMEETLRDTNCFNIKDILDTTRPLPPRAHWTWAAPTATSLAYIMFTSGSTGKPKGVMIEHRGVVRLARNNVATDCIASGAHVAHVSSIACDASTWEIYPTLLKGGTLFCIPLPTILDAAQLDEYFAHHNMQVATLTPSLLRQLIGSRPRILENLDVLYVAGDRLAAKDCLKARALVRGKMYNAYGPTENTVASTVWQIPRDLQLCCVPIGSAISNSGAFILDRQRHIVSPGVVGELVVTGDGVARGYIDASANAARFINVGVEGQICKAYCTGDLARYRPIDGQIEFLGRQDAQVKVRGHRVELTEIEHALLSEPQVLDAAVVLHQSGEAESPVILAFVVVRDGDGEDVTIGAHAQFEIKFIQRLRSRLPQYMLPARIVILDTMPLNANGKINRRALTQSAVQAGNSLPSASWTAPRDLVEAAVCSAFTDVLGTKCGVTDDFFERGGHSLAAMEVAARLTHTARLATSVRDIFENPTAAALSARLKSPSSGATNVDSEASEEYMAFQLLPSDFRHHLVDCQIQPRLKESSQGPVEDVYPTTHLQRTFLNDASKGTMRAPAVFYEDFPAGVDPIRLHTACIELVRHFNVFRTVFLPINGTIWQVVLGHIDPVVERRKVVDMADAMVSSIHALQQQFVTGSSLLHFAILSLDGKCHRVLLCMSHAVYDGLCLPTVVEAFHAFIRGEKRMPAPSFGCYMRHTANVRDAGLAHWRSLLYGSRMTSVDEDRVPMTCKEHFRAEKSIHVPPAARNAASTTTLATAFTTACAITLANISQCDDIVFGRVVSGRHSLPVAHRHVVGPCTNAVPVRLQTRQNIAQLLRAVQDQYLDGIPYETLGFDEIRDNCTDWPHSCRDYWCLTEFMNFAQCPVSHLDGERIRLEHVRQDLAPINDVLITAVLDAEGLEIRLSVVAQATYSRRLVESMLSVLSDEMVRAMGSRGPTL